MSLEIQVSDDYRVSIDKYNYTLQSRKIKKESGDEYWVNEGHYPSLSAAMNMLPEIVLHGEDFEDVVNAVARLREIGTGNG